MKLENVITALLFKSTDGMTGYDIAKHLGTLTKHSHQQIYRELKRLLERGLLNCVLEPQEGKPDRKVYTLASGIVPELLACTLSTSIEKSSLAYYLLTKDILNGTDKFSDYIKEVNQVTMKYTG